jgi:hypothetical protein
MIAVRLLLIGAIIAVLLAATVLLTMASQPKAQAESRLCPKIEWWLDNADFQKTIRRMERAYVSEGCRP